MGDINQYYFLQHELERTKQTFNNVLDIGSKDHGNVQSFRDFVKYDNYVGIDMEDGPNVDHVIDLTKSIGPLKEKSFDLTICCSVLEHVTKPWLFAENVTKLTADNGLLYVSVPFIWKYHGYPNDYYRYTHNGLKQVFDEFHFEKSYFSTYGANQIFEITSDDRFARDLSYLSLRLKNDKLRFYKNNDLIPNPKYGLDLRETDEPQKAISYIQILMIGQKK
tara:strand:- start:10525 stop:11187 length:663 start_codon:yes stop_codon:yes gene_type:complete